MQTCTLPQGPSTHQKSAKLVLMATRPLMRCTGCVNLQVKGLRAGKDKISCYWSSEDHWLQRQVRAAHWGSEPLVLCNAPANTAQPPWEPRTHSTLLSFTEAWLQGDLFSSPFPAPETNTQPGTQVMCQIDKGTGTLAPLVLNHLNFQCPDACQQPMLNAWGKLSL